MKTEKQEGRKIEFWCGGNTYLTPMLSRYKPDEPFAGPVEVSVTITSLADCELAKPTTSGLPAKVLVVGLVDWLMDFKYIKHERQITSLSIEKMEGRNPGVAFIMREVPECRQI